MSDAARVLSLVPSATEVVLALGAGERLVGISDDCRVLPGTSGLPVVSRAVIAEADPLAIDAATRDRLSEAGALYELDGELLASLAPDVVFAQDDCAVCAVPSRAVLAGLAPEVASRCRVISVDPSSLADVTGSFVTIGAALGLEAEGRALASAFSESLAAARSESVDGSDLGPVLVLDWPDPPFVAGNWVPGLMAAIGARSLATLPDEPSHPIDLAAIVGGLDWPAPVVLAPCGLTLGESVAAAHDLVRRHRGLERARIAALDGRSYFSRPGPGLVKGASALAAWLAGSPLAADVGVEIRGPAITGN